MKLKIIQFTLLHDDDVHLKYIKLCKVQENNTVKKSDCNLHFNDGNIDYEVFVKLKLILKQRYNFRYDKN